MNRLFRLGLAAFTACAVLAIAPTTSEAQIARQVSYQGLLTQPNGQPIADGQYVILARLWDAPTGGNLVWEETQPTLVAKGLFNLYLGSVVPLSGVDFFNTQLYLETAIQGQPPFPRTRLAVVPYAVRAERADKAGGLDDNATGFVRTLNGAQGDLVIQGTNGISVNRSGDTIVVSSTITFDGIRSITSPQGTLTVTNPSGPNAQLDVADGAITTAKLANNAVTGIKLADGAVSTTKIVDGAVTLQKIAPGVIPTTLPPSGPAGGDLTGTYPNPLIAPNAVTTAKIADGAITTPKISDGAVSTPKIADNSVTSAKLTTTGVIAGTYGNNLNIPRVTVDDKGRITGIVNIPLENFPWIVPAGGDLTGTYPNPLIAPNAVTTSKILDGNVTTPKLADGAVTNTKIGANSITSDKIVDGTIQAADIAPGVIPTVFPPSGPAGGELTGTYPNPTIQNNVISTAKIQDGAITNSKLGANSVTTDKIQDGTIIAADLAPGVIPTTLPPSGIAGGELTGSYPNPSIQNNVISTAKIQDGAVVNSKLGANSVTTDKILDGTIILADLAPGLIPTTLPPSGAAGGALAGTYPNPTIAPSAGNQLLTAINDGATTAKLADNRLNTTGVTAGTYGDGLTGLVPKITVDQYGRITSASQSAVMSARPTGPAGGDLAGTYPDPLLNTTSGAGGRMVTAISNSFIGGNASINTANNLVMLDASGRFPAANGSLITNLNVNNVTAGVLPIQYGGTNSNTSLVNNRIMVSNGGKIVEGPALTAGQLLIGTGAGTAPAPGSIVAGAGITVNYANPNITIASVDARLAAGTANDQTVRWDAGLQQWVPNTNILGSAAGNLTVSNNLVVSGTGAIAGNTSIGTNANTTNSIGTGANTTNTIGSVTGTNWINGTTNINTTVDKNTSIGMMSGNSSIILAAGINGNIVMENVDADPNPNAFLFLNAQREVRQGLAANMAKEGIQWQNGAFRLGGENNTTVPLESTRFINLNNQQLNFTGISGTKTLINLNGAFPTVNVTATTNINTTGTDLTTIGSPTSKTIIGGELDPRGVIRNAMGAVVVLDEFEQYGQAQINYGTEANTYIGNPTGAGNQNVQIAVGQGASGNLKLINIKNDPLITNVLWLDPANNVRYQNLVDMADEGLVFQNNRFRLGAAESGPTPLRYNSYDENRNVNLDQYAIRWRSGSEIADGVTFLEFDGDNAGAPLITATSLTNINRTGTANTNIGNALSSTDIDGPVTINDNVMGTTTIGTNGNTTHLNSNVINVGVMPYATLVNIGSTANATNTILGTTNINRTGAAITEIGTNGNTSNVLSSTINIGTGAYATGVNIGTTANATNTVLGNTFVNAAATARTQLGNGNGGAGSGRVGIGLDPTTPVYNSTHAVGPYAANVLLDVNGVAGSPNVRMASLSGSSATPYQIATDGFVIADNNGVLRRVGIDVEQGLTLQTEGGQSAFRLGALVAGNGANTNPLEVNRFVNLDNFSLTFNRGAAADAMVVINGATDAVNVNAATVDVLGATTINTTGSAQTTIGSTATGGAVNVRSSGVNPITIDVGINTNNLVLNNIATAANPDDFLRITAGNAVRRIAGANLADEGLMFENGAFRMGHSTNGSNPITSNRFVRLNGGNLTFNTAGNTMISLASTGNVGISTTGGGSTNIGSAAAGAITAQSASTVDVTAGTTLGLASVTTNINNGSGNVNLGNAAGTNTILGTTNADGNTTINDGVSAFTTNIGTAGNTGLVTVGNAANQVSILGGTNTITGTTNVNTTGNAATTIGHLANTSPVAVRANNNITLDVNSTLNNLVFNNIATAADADDFLRITAGNQVRRIGGGNIANEGIEFEGGAFRLGATPDHTVNPITTNRFVGINGGSLTFATNTGEILVGLTSGGDVNVNTTGNGLTTIGSAAAGAFSAQSASTVDLTAGTTATIASTTTNINNVSGSVNLGNAAGTNTIVGATDVNTASAATTSIGAAGNTTNLTSGTIIAANVPAGMQTDDRLVIDGANQIRRVPAIGAYPYARKGTDETRLGGAAPAADAALTVPVQSGATYEIEIYVQYSGTQSPFSALDVAVNAPVAAAADISYGVVTAGQALAPSNVDGALSYINDIGVDLVPANRLTVLIKGIVTTNAAGNIQLYWGDDTNDAGESITIHANSYIKLTRLN